MQKRTSWNVRRRERASSIFLYRKADRDRNGEVQCISIIIVLSCPRDCPAYCLIIPVKVRVAVAQPKVRKTKKFAAVKRMIGPKDGRL